jgi:rubrerythrin
VRTRPTSYDAARVAPPTTARSGRLPPMTGYYSCMACGHEFDPIATRWFCPSCKFKANCCEGEPL